MSSLTRLLGVACLFAVTASSVSASTRTLDTSKGSFAGYIWFIYSSDGGASPFAGIAIGRLPEASLEQSFGLWEENAEKRAGVLGVEKLEEVAIEGRNVLGVKVGPRDFDELRHQIYLWGRKDHGDLDAERVCENLLDRVVRQIGLKAPYRSMLRGSDTVSFLRDLDRSNR